MSDSGTEREETEFREAHRAALEALADVPPEPGAAKPDPILSASIIGRTLGGRVAVDVEHLEVQRGTITARVGPNGAGKTALFNLLTGFDRPNGGTWEFDGRVAKRLRSYQMAQAGMVRTFQL